MKSCQLLFKQTKKDMKQKQNTTTITYFCEGKDILTPKAWKEANSEQRIMPFKLAG